MPPWWWGVCTCGAWTTDPSRRVHTEPPPTRQHHCLLNRKKFCTQSIKNNIALFQSPFSSIFPIHNLSFVISYDFRLMLRSAVAFITTLDDIKIIKTAVSMSQYPQISSLLQNSLLIFLESRLVHFFYRCMIYSLSPNAAIWLRNFMCWSPRDALWYQIIAMLMHCRLTELPGSSPVMSIMVQWVKNFNFSRI